MKTFILDIIRKLKAYSKKLDDITLLTNKKWILIDDTGRKIIFVFEKGGRLMISKNGLIEYTDWKYYLNNSLIIRQNKNEVLYEHGFMDDSVLALKVENFQNQYALFVNEDKIEQNTIETFKKYLEDKYKNKLNSTNGGNQGGEVLKPKPTIENPSGDWVVLVKIVQYIVVTIILIMFFIVFLAFIISVLK